MSSWGNDISVRKAYRVPNLSTASDLQQDPKPDNLPIFPHYFGFQFPCFRACVRMPSTPSPKRRGSGEGWNCVLRTGLTCIEKLPSWLGFCILQGS